MDVDNFSHLTEESLEEYVFTRLRPSEAAKVEEHLLLCDRCRDALEGIDELIGIIRGALREESVASPSDEVHNSLALLVHEG